LAAGAGALVLGGSGGTAGNAAVADVPPAEVRGALPGGVSGLAGAAAVGGLGVAGFAGATSGFGRLAPLGAGGGLLVCACTGVLSSPTDTARMGKARRTNTDQSFSVVVEP
jgi:hypothetical protein